MINGYIVMSAPGNKEHPDYFAPLSYGKGAEPQHDLLLRRSSRVIMFDTEHEARTALEKTLRQATADGDKWPKKNQYFILPVESQPKFASVVDGRACLDGVPI